MKKEKDFKYLEDLLKDPEEILLEQESEGEQTEPQTDEIPAIETESEISDGEETEIRKKTKQKTKKNNAFSSKIKTLLILLVLVAVIVGAVLLVAGLIDRANSSFINGAGVYYPITPDSVLDMKPFPDGVTVLTGNTVEYVDGTGKLIAKNSHLYSDPVIKTAGKHVLLYDKGGTDLRVEKNGRINNTIKTEAEIGNGAVAPNGTFAYALNADGSYQTHVFVRSASEKLLFEWGGADYLLGIALSDNGKRVVFSTLSVKNASYITHVFVYEISSDKKELLADVSFEAEAAFSVCFLNGKEVGVLTDNGVYKINSDGELVSVSSYSANELTHEAVYPGGLSCVSLHLFGNEKNTEVRFYNKRFDHVFTENFTESVVSLNTCGNRAALCFSDHIIVLDQSQNRIGAFVLPESVYRSLLSGDRVYILTANGIRCYRADFSDTLISE